MINVSSSDNEFIEKLNKTILERITDSQFGVSELAREMGMSHSNLHRKVREITGKTVTNLISETRLKRAMEILKQGTRTVSEVAYDTGFNSVTYFDKCFLDYFGYQPGEVKKRTSEDESKYPDNEIKESSPEIDLLPAKKNPKRQLIFILAGILVVIIAGFLVYSLFFSPTGKWAGIKFTIPEKSIAILPFINDSHDSSNIYFINGVTEAITDKLSQIKDLKVTSRNSAEQYRNNKTKLTPQVGRELGVKYILEGSGQKIGDSVLVTVQLIEARNDKHIFSQQYAGKYENIFNLYTEIALNVASEIKVLITPEEKQLIEKPTTEKTDAMRFLIQGNELRGNYNPTKEQVKQAEAFYRNAIRLDSTYSDAWVQLGNISMNKRLIDSAFFMANMALQFDKKNSEAYNLIANLYRSRYMRDEMEEALMQSLKCDPVNPWTYHWLGGLYYSQGKFSKAIDNLLKAQELIGDLKPDFSSTELRRLEWNTLHIFRCLFALGFYEEGKEYADLWLRLSNDEPGYLYNLLWSEIVNCHFEEAYQLFVQNKDKASKIPFYHVFGGIDMLYLKKIAEASSILNQKIELDKNRGRRSTRFYHLVGFTLLKSGQKVESEKYFKAAISFYDSLLMSQPERKEPGYYCDITDGYYQTPYFVYTCIWSVRDDKGKALENMRLLRKYYRAYDFQVVTFLKYFPMFDNIRNEPEFREYLNEAETHYLTEHKKVEILLREKGIIK